MNKEYITKQFNIQKEIYRCRRKRLDVYVFLTELTMNFPVTRRFQVSWKPVELNDDKAGGTAKLYPFWRKQIWKYNFRRLYIFHPQLSLLLFKDSYVFSDWKVIPHMLTYFPIWK
jgi:hypothetical protein